MAISTIAVSGGDYTTLDSWIASLPATLTEQEVAEIDGWLGDIGQQTLSVATTETNNLIIRAKAGQETDYSTTSTKAGFAEMTGFKAGIELGVNCNHVSIEKIGIRLGSNCNLFTNTGSPTASTNPKISMTDCWYFSLENPLFMFDGGDLVRPTEITNCLGMNVRGHGLSTSTNYPVFTNCTHVFSIVFAANSGSAGFRYCVTNKCFAAHYGPTSGWGCFLNRRAGSGNDGATDTTADRFDNLVLTDQYVDPANNNWSLKATATLKGGASDSTDIGFVAPSGGTQPPPQTLPPAAPVFFVS